MLKSKNQKDVKTTVKHIISPASNVEHRFVPEQEELKKMVDLFKKMGYKVVLTQGVYDLIHGGHAAYLDVARSYGDVLIVGVDSDELTKKRKGPNRPIVPQDERIKMLAHLRSVDVVTLRDVGSEIGDLIRLVEPDVLVVSKSTKDFDYKTAMEYKDVCGEIISLPPQGVATTSARIRNLTIEGAEELAREMNKIIQEFLNKIRKS